MMNLLGNKKTAINNGETPGCSVLTTTMVERVAIGEDELAYRIHGSNLIRF